MSKHIIGDWLYQEKQNSDDTSIPVYWEAYPVKKRTANRVYFDKGTRQRKFLSLHELEEKGVAKIDREDGSFYTELPEGARLYGAWVREEHKAKMEKTSAKPERPLKP